MTNSRIVRGVKLAAAGAVLATLGACATNEQATMKLDALEAKVNEALQSSAAAKIDAATALDIALDVEKKVK